MKAVVSLACLTALCSLLLAGANGQFVSPLFGPSPDAPLSYFAGTSELSSLSSPSSPGSPSPSSSPDSPSTSSPTSPTPSSSYITSSAGSVAVLIVIAAVVFFALIVVGIITIGYNAKGMRAKFMYGKAFTGSSDALEPYSTQDGY